MNEYPRASKYDPEWMKANMMGPNASYLLELLCDHMEISEGMRVLDLGCGRGITSVFLAKEFGVQVWATDLWIAATDNFTRFMEAGVSDMVYPIHAEAHELPYADGFFDAAVSIDAYHYFGTEEGYLDKHLAKLIKPGGQIGIVVPGLSRELKEKEIPPGLESY
jgi:cyclopropane fatty-acyl-phospholipid synthase-like methyltransferase